MSGFDFDLARKVLAVAQETGLNEVEITFGEAHFSAVTTQAKPKPAPAPAVGTAIPAPEAPEFLPLKSVAVGYFYPVQNLAVGYEVIKGEVIGSLSALGISNDVLATHSGTVTKVFATEGDAVQYGQVLAEVKP